MQIAALISVAFAGTDDAGRASLYWYAVMLLVLLNAALASPISVVFAPVVARDFSHDKSGRRGTRIACVSRILDPCRPRRRGTVPSRPAAGGVGADQALGLGDRRHLHPAVRPLAGTARCSADGDSLLLVLAEGRLVQLAKWSTVVLAGHAALTAGAAALDLGLLGIAVVATVPAFALCGAIVVLGMRAHALGVARGAAKAVGAVVVPALVAFLVPAVALDGGDSLAKGAAAWLTGSLLFLCWLLVVRREELDELLSVVGRPRA